MLVTRLELTRLEQNRLELAKLAGSGRTDS